MVHRLSYGGTSGVILGLRIYVDSVCGFLFKESFSVSLVKLYLATICHARIALSIGDPRIASMSKLEYVTEGMHKITSAREQRTQLLVTLSVIRKMKDTREHLPYQEDSAMLWAVSCL